MLEQFSCCCGVDDLAACRFPDKKQVFDLRENGHGYGGPPVPLHENCQHSGAIAALPIEG
jgi:hypothetical protein